MCVQFTFPLDCFFAKFCLKGACLVSQGSGIPAPAPNAQWQTASMDQDLLTFATSCIEQSIYHRPGTAAPRLLTATQDVVRAARREGEWRLMARWNSIMTNPLGGYKRVPPGCFKCASGGGGAAWSCQQGATRKTSERSAQLNAEDVLWSLGDLICIVLISSQQTVARLWQRPTLTNNSFNCGEQIVSTLILSNVCLSFTGAVHEKLSDTGAKPEVTSHHIFSSYEAACSKMLKRVTWQNHLCLWACT